MMTHAHVGEGANGNTFKPFLNGNVNANGVRHAVENILIRPYCAEDRASIRRICCDTGFLGNPIEAIFSDREIFADLFTGPYLNYEPNRAWVADDRGRVVGYLLGSISPAFEYTLLYSGFQTAMKMIARAATGRYSHHPRTKHFIRWLLTNGYREQPKHPASAAHLHLDLEKKYRGHGIACRLWRTFETQLQRANIKHCYGAFFSWPQRRPENSYTRFGFSVFDRKPTTIFKPEISEPVEVVCVQKKIGK